MTHKNTTIANIINTLNPELVIINGGIISTGEILLDPIVETVRKKGFSNSVNATDIVLSKLGNVAYLKGAVVLATQHIFDNPELAKKKSENVVNDAVSFGAEEIVTACPLCLYNLQSNGAGVKVKYFTELLAEALGVKDE